MDIQIWLGAWVYRLYKNTTGIKQHNAANSRSPLSGIDTGDDALGLLGYPMFGSWFSSACYHQHRSPK